MNRLHEILARESLQFWPAFADHLWQATLFALVVFVLTLALKHSPARVRYALWLVASAKFIIPAALIARLAALWHFDFHWSFSATSETATAKTPDVFYKIAQPLTAFTDDGARTPLASSHNELICALTILWLAGCALILSVWFVRRRKFLASLKCGRRVIEGREYDALLSARRRLKLKVLPSLVISTARTEPGVWRNLRPVLVLPETLAEHLDDEELEAVLLHELAHVKRRDNLTANLQMLVSVALWFHPLVWFIEHRLMDERESACDEMVLGINGISNAYASGILKVVRLCFGWRMAGVAGVGNGSNLRRRIENIMSGKTNLSWTRGHRVLLSVAIVAALIYTIGMGLSAKGQSAASKAQDPGADAMRRASQAAGAGRARRRREPGPAVQEVMQSPDTSIPFENSASAPLIINGATMKIVTREQMQRAADEEADYLDDDSMRARKSGADESGLHATLPRITLTNTSGKTVREVGIGYVVNGRTVVMSGYAETFQPGETRAIESGWWRRNVILPNRASEITLKVSWATFTDGTQWGERPTPPLPPPPPPPGESTYGVRTSTATPMLESNNGEDSGSNRLGKPISLPEPDYPEIARRANATGTVTVRVTVDETGRVISAKAVSGHPLLQAAAVEAANKAQFEPKMLNGQVTKAEGLLSYFFSVP